MKYLVCIIISLALFILFRPEHSYTLETWFYLLLIHSPVPALMFALEKTRRIRFHPVICFIATWTGGLALGFLIGPSLITLLNGMASLEHLCEVRG
jgi:hypothetical protein